MNMVQITRSQLSKLALDAAMELESSSNVDSRQNVENFLNVISDQIKNENGKSVLKDETLYPVYSFAFSNAMGLNNSSVRRDGMNVVEEAIRSSLRSNADNETDFLKSFCLSVHEVLVTELLSRRTAAVRRDERVRIH